MPTIIIKTFVQSVALAGLALLIWLGVMSFWNSPGLPLTRATVATGPVILEAVKHVNKQIFIEHYETIDITRSETPTGWLGWLGSLGVKQEFVVLLRGRVPAGFDLAQLGAADIWVSADGRRAQITLPPPQIFADNVAIDFANSRVLAQSDRCPNVLCSSDIAAYQSQVLPAGQQRMIEAAQQHGILEQAADEGRAYFEQLLRSLGFSEVRVVVRGYGV